jgi:hypothetical protein
MDRLVFVPLILLLSACTFVQNAPVITPTGTPVTPTNKTPSTTPTARPSETPSPEVDPNKPPGATGKDKDGNYIKPWMKADGTPMVDDNNNQLFETWVSIPAGPNGELFESWTEPHIKNPTFNGGIQAGDRDIKTVSIRFSVKEGITAPYLSHINTAEQSLFSREFYGKLYERILNKRLRNITNEEAAKIMGDLDAGRVTIPVTDVQGNTFELAINDKTKVNVFLAAPGDFTPDAESTGSQSRTTFVLDANGNIETINIIVATKSERSLEEFTPMEFIGLTVRPFFVLVAPNEAGVSQLLRASVREPNQYFQIINDAPVTP